MAKSDILYLPSKYGSFAVSFLNSDGASTKTLVEAPMDDANLIWLNITTTNLTDIEILLSLSFAENDYVIGCIKVPAEAGTNSSVSSVNVLESLRTLPIDDTSINYMPLKAGTLLKISLKSAVESGKLMNIYGVYSDYSK